MKVFINIPRDYFFDLHDNVCNQKYNKTLPYSFHLEMVEAQAVLFERHIPCDNPYNSDIWIGIYGHDSIEDARLTYKDIVERFGDAAKSIYSTSFIKAPTITDVIMWLYEKHGIWICVYTMDKWLPNGNDREQLFDYGIKQMKRGLIDISKKPEEFNSPKEAYEAAIEYVLNNLI